MSQRHLLPSLSLRLFPMLYEVHFISMANMELSFNGNCVVVLERRFQRSAGTCATRLVNKGLRET